MQPSRYAAALRNSWALLLAGALLGLVASLGYSATIAPTYRASTTLFFAPARGQTVGELNQGSTYTQSLMESFTQVVTQPAVLEPVITQLALPLTPKQLARQVQAETPLDSLVMTVAVTADDPEASAAIANAIAGQLRTTVTQLVPQRGNARPIDVTTVAQAQAPQVQAGPSRTRNAVLGVAVGLALAAGLALARTALPQQVRNREQVTELTGLSVLGRVPHRGRQQGARVDPSAGDAFRRLRLTLVGAITEAAQQGGGALIVVTSCVRHEGRSTAAAGLAASWAEAGVRVLLIDADLRARSGATASTREQLGLAAVLLDRADLGAAIEQIDGSNLRLLESGPLPPDAGALISGSAMRELLATVRQQFDIVVLDTPPLLESADALVLGEQASGTLLVVDTSRITDRDLDDAGRQLRQAGVPAFGVVLNDGQHSRIPGRQLLASPAGQASSVRWRPAGSGSLRRT